MRFDATIGGIRIGIGGIGIGGVGCIGISGINGVSGISGISGISGKRHAEAVPHRLTPLALIPTIGRSRSMFDLCVLFRSPQQKS